MKLWWIYNRLYTDDFWLVIAENQQELFQNFNKEFVKNYSNEYFEENFEWSSVEKLGNYKIIVEKMQ
jgi:hypothetical protein